jgi:hypothetical protein
VLLVNENLATITEFFYAIFYFDDLIDKTGYAQRRAH